MINLRPYQEKAVEELREAIRAGYRNILLCAPTGAGKTLISAYLIQESYRKRRRSAFVCDQINLIDQTSDVFTNYGIPHGVIQGQHPKWAPWERVQICSAQTLNRRKWPDADLIVIDECHIVHKTVSDKISSREHITIGLTATPFTKGLGKLYDTMVNVTTTNDLLDKNYLSNFRIFAPSEPNMEGVKVVGGEWDGAETSKRALEVVGDCVAEYLKHGDNQKFICSAVDINHARELHRQFMAAGVMCAVYTSDVKDDERAQIVEEFRKSDSYIRGLLTVTAATKGFDVPDIGVIIMARPLRKSLAQHIQFFGRGLRIHPNKTECLVLDHSGNTERFLDEWQHFFQFGIQELDDGKKKEKKKTVTNEEDRLIKCQHCKHLHKPMPFCPHCGHEYPKRSSVQHKTGTLKELIASGDRKAMTNELWPQIVRYALNHKTPDKAEKYALAMFRNITGVWPATNFYDTTPSDDVSNSVINKIKQKNIAYARSMVRRAA